MTREKVKLDFIEDITKRKASYKKRQKGFLSKAHELNTLCDVELAIVVYSPYHEAPKVFPNHEATFNTFTKFKELPTLVQSNSITPEKITKQRIKKMEKQLRKVRKENRIMELTNQMYELLNGKDIPTNMHPNDINNLNYIVNQHIKQVHDSIIVKAHEDGSTSHAPQPIAGVIVRGGTSFDMPRAPLLASVVARVSVDPLVGPSMIPDGTNCERPMAPLLVPDVTPISMALSTDPLMVLSTAPAQVPQLMFDKVSPLRTSLQMAPLGDLSQVPSSFSSHTFPLIPHQTRAIEMTHPIPPTTMAYPMPSLTADPPMSNLVFPPIAPEIHPSMNIPSMNASVPIDNNHNCSFGIPRSPSFSQLLSLSDDDIRTLLDDTRTLLDDTSFNIYVQDPNHHHQGNL